MSPDMRFLLNLPIKWKLAAGFSLGLVGLVLVAVAATLTKPFVLDQVDGELKRVLGKE